MSVEPGAVCPTCDRRVNKPKQQSSPTTKVVSIGRLPVERQEALDNALKALLHYTGATNASYPAGSLLEAMVVLAGQHREELRAYFEGER